MKLPSLPAGVPSLLLLAAGGLLLLRVNACYAERDGALKAQIHARDLTIAALATQHHTDTLRLVTTRRHTDSLLITDTVIHVDTVRQLIAAERVACDALVGTCEAEKAALRDKIRLLEKARPGFLRRTFACTVGPTVTRRGFDYLGASCGVRF